MNVSVSKYSTIKLLALLELDSLGIISIKRLEVDECEQLENLTSSRKPQTTRSNFT